MGDRIPVVDVSGVVAGDDAAVRRAGAQIDAACRDVGFFAVAGHGVDPRLRADLDRLSRRFFALPEATKARIAMSHGGRAWRGWFPLGGELTSGVPDAKEGLYFGAELPAGDPRPLHGPNLFPEQPEGLRPTVLAWIDALTALGQHVLRAMAAGLGLDPDWFATGLTADPLVLFRVFRYPPAEPGAWGVAEHTDYGLVTLLGQDPSGGLEVRTPTGWVDVPADPDLFVCNVGDMLERMTGGAWRSTPHRVRNPGGTERLSYPFFLDPGWDAEVRPVPGLGDRTAVRRWDGTDPHAWTGTYGDYLLAKVAKVFPDLAGDALAP